MIYAQIHSYTDAAGNAQSTIAARSDQPDSSWIAYDVPSADWLSIASGAIVVATVDPAIAQAQVSQSALMQTECKSAIVAGFASSALGSAYTYGCKPTDQSNINTLASIGGNIWCQNSSGVWTIVSHTASEVQQVQKDMAAHIQAQQAIYEKALTDIAAATTVAEVEAITWAAP